MNIGKQLKLEQVILCIKNNLGTAHIVDSFVVSYRLPNLFIYSCLDSYNTHQIILNLIKSSYIQMSRPYNNIILAF